MAGVNDTPTGPELTSSSAPEFGSLPPAKRPCGSCPYRRDTPSGVWHPEEYGRLPSYDAPTPEQPTRAFHCHQVDGRLCAGWVGCHDMDENLAIRIAYFDGSLSLESMDAVLDYSTDVELFDSGLEAACHGLLDVVNPTPAAQRVIAGLIRKRGSSLTR